MQDKETKAEDTKPKKDKVKEEKKKEKKVKEKKSKNKKGKSKKTKYAKYIIKFVLNVFFMAALIIAIIYLVKSDRGLVGRMNQKTASEKLNAAINNFVSTETDRDLEEFIREIEGLDEINVNRDAGTMELTIDGQGFLVVVGGTSPDQMNEENGTMVDEGIYVEELQTEEEQNGEGQAQNVEDSQDVNQEGEQSTDEENKNNDQQTDTEGDENSEQE